MQLIEPDLLADASGLAPGLSACGIVLGLALWLFGWSRHRFWVVLALTLAGGIYGLNEGASLHAQPVVAGILLAWWTGFRGPLITDINSDDVGVAHRADIDSAL